MTNTVATGNRFHQLRRQIEAVVTLVTGHVKIRTGVGDGVRPDHRSGRAGQSDCSEVDVIVAVIAVNGDVGQLAVQVELIALPPETRLVSISLTVTVSLLAPPWALEEDTRPAKVMVSSSSLPLTGTCSFRVTSMLSRLALITELMLPIRSMLSMP